MYDSYLRCPPRSFEPKTLVLVPRVPDNEINVLQLSNMGFNMLRLEECFKTFQNPVVDLAAVYQHPFLTDDGLKMCHIPGKGRGVCSTKIFRQVQTFEFSLFKANCPHVCVHYRVK